MTGSGTTRADVLLDRAAAAREVATLVALTLIRENGDPEAALAFLAECAKLVFAEDEELDASTIAAQAIRDALAMGVVGR